MKKSCQPHAQLATALETFEVDTELLAEHLLAAGLPARTAVHFERAAENAAAALAFMPRACVAAPSRSTPPTPERSAAVGRK